MFVLIIIRLVSPWILFRKEMSCHPVSALARPIPIERQEPSVALVAGIAFLSALQHLEGDEDYFKESMGIVRCHVAAVRETRGVKEQMGRIDQRTLRLPFV